MAVDLDYPNQKMFHPMPPSLGPGVYLGAVERATSFITDDLWYGIFAGTNPGNEVLAMVVYRTYVHLCWQIVSMSYSLSLKVFLEDRGKEGYQLVLVQPSCRYKSPLFCMN